MLRHRAVLQPLFQRKIGLNVKVQQFAFHVTRTSFTYTSNPLLRRSTSQVPYLHKAVYNSNDVGHCHLLNHISCGPLLNDHLGTISSYRHGLHTESRKHKKNLVQKIPMSFSSLVEMSPTQYQPYLRLLRLHQPIGIWLLFLPGAWSIAMATEAGHFPDAVLIGKFFVGSVLMRGAGCIVNDMMDTEYDKKVKRTKARPLASGELTHKQAVKCLAGQLTAALCILLTFDQYSILLGAISVLPTTMYPLMKRYTHWPQLFLGVTFNWGVLLGWSVVNHGAMDWSVVLPLYTACISWTMIYDTIYAHQDKVDDILIGVKSTAIYFGNRTQEWLYGFSGVMAVGLMYAGINSGQTLPYYIGATYMCGSLLNMVRTTRLSESGDCAKSFLASRWLGVMMFGAIVASTLMKRKVKAEGISNTENHNNVTT